ncbi:hypothetical protein BP6252_06813 [Coleophoma cylindrospora]|uniref:Xylanolytic transcriptional activator regulatory domain-containing protein n=1 Tax=Coleophoma cylindrospora TaxID=1849047 RepID=A0A3D8RG12_9HELO|nr:hypothetical protein BP6252_06813 [Coleophoma cylindrospora]
MTRARRTATQSPLSTPDRPVEASFRKTNGPGQSTRRFIAVEFHPASDHITPLSATAQSCSLSSADKSQTLSICETAETSDWYDQSLEAETSFPRSAKYYGPTSFTSVFTENDLFDHNDEQGYPSPMQFSQPLLGQDRSSAPTARRNQIIMALRNIPSHDICKTFMDEFGSQYHIAMNVVLIKHGIAGLWSTFGEQLSLPRTPEKLNLIAEALFKNEKKPLPPSPDDGMEWLDTFNGPNLRFEMLGMLFCFFGLAYHCLPDKDRRFDVPENLGRDRKQTCWRMKECADICIKSCTISETNNEISVALMHCTLILDSLCIGDESLHLRRRHAETIVSALAAGLHRLDVGTTKITTALEYKRRLISAMYCTDKNDASMNGLPVSLSQKFIHLRLPLDISEDDLFQTPDELARICSELDSSGWNRDGETHYVTIHRAIQLLCRCREEILEVALSVGLAINSRQIEDLIARCRLAYDSLPPTIHYYKYGTTPKDSTGRALLDQAYVMLLNLQNQFLVDRVASARGFPNDQRLLDTAMEMLQLSNMYWIRRDELAEFYHNFDWIVTCYGIPSSGVICVELLKQSKGQSALHFSRSDAIQKLTVFVHFLEWIRPTDGNYALAQRLKTVIKSVIDHILDSPQRPQPGQNETENAVVDFSVDPMLASPDTDTMDWLNTIDWTQGHGWALNDARFDSV